MPLIWAELKIPPLNLWNYPAWVVPSLNNELENKMSYELKEIVYKLTGEIDPIGDSSVDATRLNNLKTLGDLVVELLEDLVYVANTYENNHQASMKQASNKAKFFINEIKETIGEQDAHNRIDRSRV